MHLSSSALQTSSVLLCAPKRPPCADNGTMLACMRWLACALLQAIVLTAAGSGTAVLPKHCWICASARMGEEAYLGDALAARRA